MNWRHNDNYYESLEDAETYRIKEEISRCEDIDELKTEVLSLLTDQRSQWIKKFGTLLKNSGLNKSAFAQRCGVSRVSVDKWSKGSIPKSRETFIFIGMCAGLDVPGTNHLLQRYGQYPALYSKSPEDCICMYILNKPDSGNRVGEYQYILSGIQTMLISGPKSAGDVRTIMLDDMVKEIDDEDGLMDYIRENAYAFATAYTKLYSYIKMCIMANNDEGLMSVNNLAEGQGWSSSLKQCVSAIRNGKWYPTRNKIISLGLHLSMDHEQVDKMLELAHMEPLCAKNIFESIIMFVLDDAQLNGLLDQEMEEYDPDALCRYAAQVLREINLPETESFLAELEEIE